MVSNTLNRRKTSKNISSFTLTLLLNLPPSRPSLGPPGPGSAPYSGPLQILRYLPCLGFTQRRLVGAFGDSRIDISPETLLAHDLVGLASNGFRTAFIEHLQCSSCTQQGSFTVCSFLFTSSVPEIYVCHEMISLQRCFTDEETETQKG